MSDLRVEVHVARPPDVVRRWWLEFPDDYVATDPREQPHRMRVTERRADGFDVLTWWRGPFGDLRVPESFTFTPDGWTVDLRLPLGLRQRDVFRLEPAGDGTRVTVDVDVRPRNALGRLTRAPFLADARKRYRKTWETAARLCEEATPPAGAGPSPRT